MGKRILILDDDSDFNSLLTDIYIQAKYEVVSERDPELAVDLFKGDDFDLVVTDQKMPGLTGEEFIRAIKKMKPEVPVIMVSGYLDNDTIRNLIREGVGGVFLKPLNVFSLLKRTSALIEATSGEADRPVSGPHEADAGDFDNGLPFTFESYPCRAGPSLDFAKRLYAVRGFKSNLVLIGEEGTDVGSILEDIRRFDPEAGEAFSTLDLDNLDEAAVLKELDEATRAGANRLTLLLARPDLMHPEQAEIVYAAAKKRGPFEKYAIALRYIFFVNKDIDTLYDTSKIDDNLYMFLGTTEVKVPRLVDVRDDIPLIARRVACSEAARQGFSSLPTVEKTAISYLREKEWFGGMLELKRLIRAAVTESGGQPITRNALEEASRQVSNNRVDSERNFKHQLVMRRNDYLKAVYLLCGSELELAAEVLGVDKQLVAETVAPGD